jgi:hypothetical protein
MLRNPDFNSKDLDPDLHKRMNRAVDDHDGRIKSFNTREGPADGDQDLNLWLRELEDVVREDVVCQKGRSLKRFTERSVQRRLVSVARRCEID